MLYMVIEYFNAGAAPDISEVQELVDLYRAWRAAATSEEYIRNQYRVWLSYLEQGTTLAGGSEAS